MIYLVLSGDGPSIAEFGRARPMAAKASALLHSSFSRTVAQLLGRVLSGKSDTDIATFVPILTA
jgi:hypothetical protein